MVKVFDAKMDGYDISNLSKDIKYAKEKMHVIIIR